MRKLLPQDVACAGRKKSMYLTMPFPREDERFTKNIPNIIVCELLR